MTTSSQQQGRRDLALTIITGVIAAAATTFAIVAAGFMFTL